MSEDPQMKERCRSVLEELDTYLDGECGQRIEEVVREHLEDCPPCLERADFRRELRSIIASKCRDAAPSGLLDRVLQRLQDA